MKKIFVKAYQAVLTAKEGHLLLGGVASGVSWPFETPQLAQDELEANVSINTGCHIPIDKAYIRSCLTNRKIITEKEVYGTWRDSSTQRPKN
jgi:hypothetical protein